MSAAVAGGAEVVLEMLRRRLGLVFGDARTAEVTAAVERRMAAARVANPARYLERLLADETLLNGLIEECTVGETYFFREPEQLHFIRSHVIPEIATRRPTGPVRVWSAGCASGEEPYSLRILLRESSVADRGVVIGTDAARARLTKARRGRYTRWSLRGVPDVVVQRYFTSRGRHFDLAPEIRSSVKFRYLNLAADEYPSSRAGVWEIDLLLCRNVLIYLDRDALAGVAARLYRSLAPGGWLFLSASDPSIAELAPFETMMTDRGVVYRRPVTPSHRTVSTTAALAEPVTPVRATPRSTTTNATSPSSSVSPVAPAAAAAVDQGATASRVRELADRGKLTEAGIACAAALEQDGRSTELLYLHALLLTQAGLYREAADAARRLLYLDGDLAIGHMALGSALMRLKDPVGARRSFRNALRSLDALDPAEPVPGSGGEPAGRLRDLAGAQLRLLDGVAK